VRGDPADGVITAGGGALVAAPVEPVFVDATGRRRKVVIGFGWLVALACIAYLGVIGVSLTGTSVGPLPELPSVASRSVVFGAEAAGIPQGALEVPLPTPAPLAAPAAAATPNWGNAAKVAVAPKTAVQAAPKAAPKTTVKTAPKTTVKAAPKTTAKTGSANGSTTTRRSSSGRIGSVSS
jgi:hypothetical protein